MKADFGLYTFITSVTILGLEIYQTLHRTALVVQQEIRLDEPVPDSPDQGSRLTVEGDYGLFYADFEYPHPSYVHVAPHDMVQEPLDTLKELAKLRIAANTQRRILTSANRMPPETPVSKMIAERTRAYMAEDARQGEREVQRSVPAPGLTRPDEQPPFKTSSELWSYVSSKYANRVGVILGVGDGAYASSLLQVWKATYIYLVDPYIHIWRGYDRAGNVDDKSHQLLYEKLRYQFTVAFEGRFMFVRDFSTEFANTYRKASGQPAPGFVFIDANPSYESVKADIAAWYPLLQPGGLMAGTMYVASDQTVGVKKAVDEFAAGKTLRLLVIAEGFWALEKPL